MGDAKRYAVLGDVHGNWEALGAVLDDAAAQGVTDHVCVGDLVGYNADPAACLDRIREICSTVVRGNHDHYCVHDECLDDFHPLAASVVEWTREQLGDEQKAYLQGLNLSALVDGFTLVHSTLDMPEKWGYVFDTLQADANFAYQSTALCFHGHTHLPVVFEKLGRVVRRSVETVRLQLGKKYFVNIGSVGQPRDGDPRASYVVYDTAARTIHFRRVAYDIAAVQKKIRDAGLPERLALRLETGK
jgi:diadenosine tetraphosphatase ApaH/serine/threonine PP2A family protein phosphatase